MQKNDRKDVYINIDKQKKKPKKSTEQIRRSNTFIKPREEKTLLGTDVSNLAKMNEQSLPEVRNKKREKAIDLTTDHIDSAIADHKRKRLEKESSNIERTEQNSSNKIENTVYSVINRDIGDNEIFGYNSHSNNNFSSELRQENSDTMTSQLNSLQETGSHEMQQDNIEEPIDLTPELHREHTRQDFESRKNKIESELRSIPFFHLKNVGINIRSQAESPYKTHMLNAVKTVKWFLREQVPAKNRGNMKVMDTSGDKLYEALAAVTSHVAGSHIVPNVDVQYIRQKTAEYIAPTPIEDFEKWYHTTI